MDKITELITKGVDKIYPSSDIFEKVLRSGQKIRLYQGFDPSMPDLHLGNMVGLLKLKQFQDLGHEVIFLVGDFTGMIGDPTDKTAARVKLSREQVLENSKSWHAQAGKILDFRGSNPAKIMYNSTWGDKVTFKDLIEITSNFTVQQMLERDFFQKRLKEEKPIYLHEFLYPIAQAIDCVEMDVDLEIGGSDQTFNMLCGRTLMKDLKNKEKYVLTTKLLVDASGQKVGKTTGNAFFMNLTAPIMYGAVMSFPDEVILPSFELLTTKSMSEISALRRDLKTGKISAMNLKKQLALEIVSLCHSPKDAEQAQTEFEQVFQHKSLPDDLPLFRSDKKSYNLIDLMTVTKLVPSKSEAKRLIAQKAVEINGQVQTDINKTIELKSQTILKVGKHKFIKIVAAK
jgi:tyrosyl-tRNA synthetase